METLDEKIRRVVMERIDVVPYDGAWNSLFQEERARLLAWTPAELVLRIEHFGSTAVPGLPAKPIIDMVIEVSDVQWAKVLFPQVLEPQGYDCFWRPSFGDDVPPWYTWCIRRDKAGRRTHHLHVGAPGFKEEALRFRDILRSRSDVAAAYAELKLQLAQAHQHDRVGYTEAKTRFIEATMHGRGGP